MYLFSIMPETYKSLVIPEEDGYITYDCLRWAGRPKSETWKVPTVAWLDDEFTSDSAEIADFIAFGGGPVALSDRAYNVLKNLFGDQVEFLPVNGPSADDSWLLMNVINVLDIMDVSKSKYEIYHTGEVGDVSHAHINEPKPDNHIFLVQGNFPLIFIDQETKDVIESAGLTGTLIREYLNP